MCIQIKSSNKFPVSFKKRKNTGYNSKKISFGMSALRLKKSFLLEKIYLVFLKRKVKRLIKKSFKKTKVWFFLAVNYPISRKGKNSRMGKGKGAYKRTVIRVKKYKTFLEFSSINLIFLKKIKKFFKKRTGLDLSIIFNKKKRFFLKRAELSFYNVYKRF